MKEWNCSQGDFNARCPNYDGWLSVIKSGGTIKGHYNNPSRVVPLCVHVVNAYGGSAQGAFTPAGNFTVFMYRWESLWYHCDIFKQRTGDEFKNAMCKFVQKDQKSDPNFYAEHGEGPQKSLYGRSRFKAICGIQLP